MIRKNADRDQHVEQKDEGRESEGEEKLFVSLSYAFPYQTAMIVDSYSFLCYYLPSVQTPHSLQCPVTEFLAIGIWHSPHLPSLEN